MLPIELRPLDMFLQLVEKGHFLAAQDLVPMVRTTIEDLVESQLEEDEDLDTAIDAALGKACELVVKAQEEKPAEELATVPQ